MEKHSRKGECTARSALHCAYNVSPLMLPEPQPQPQQQAVPQIQQLAVPLNVPPSTSAEPFDSALFLYEIALRSRRPSECADSPAARRFYYPTHLPVYHFERTVQSAQSSDGGLWVAVCSLDIRMAGQSDMSRLKRFKSTQTTHEPRRKTRSGHADTGSRDVDGDIQRSRKTNQRAALRRHLLQSTPTRSRWPFDTTTSRRRRTTVARHWTDCSHTSISPQSYTAFTRRSIPNVRGGAKTMWKCAVELNLHFADERNRPATSISAAATRKTEAKAAVATESVRYIINQLTCAQPISPPRANCALNAFSNGLTSSLFAFQPQTHRREQ